MKIKPNYRFYSLLVLLLFSVQYLPAQTTRADYNYFMKEFKRLFNEKKSDEIYVQSSATYQSKISKEKFSLGMRKFVANVGIMQHFSFVDSTTNGYNYTIQFENSEQLFSVLLDNQKQVLRMNFKELPFLIEDKNFKVGSNNPLKDSIDLLVEKFVRPYIQKGATTGIMLAVIDGKRQRRYSYGTIARTSKQLPDASKSIFEIGSVTKIFTSLLLAKEVVDGNLQLEDPISKYLPDSIPLLAWHGHPITLAQLSNHTAGFPRLPDNIFTTNAVLADPYSHYKVDSLFHFLKKYKVSSQTGIKFSYSNLGAGVLGVALERHNNKSFGQLVIDNICLPLGMKNTSLEDAGVVQGYNEKGKPTSYWHLESLAGSGAIRSTLDDMIIFMRAQLGSKNKLQKAIHLTHQITLANDDQIMALGWRVKKAGSKTLFHHSGGTGGFRSFVAFDDKSKKAIIILSNAALDVTTVGFSIFENCL
ncbi:serine hydrolase domain-containing protein [Sphingobacterium sp.]|uniref:serine hydrolase domain-containing protein n=1 Tax=Sphingobacterium sp. TaxID=341027 RepID=UPI0028AE58F8|nr:serine hydrolase domain-containing protein [Sphingobacterium sp.]